MKDSRTEKASARVTIAPAAGEPERPWWCVTTQLHATQRGEVARSAHLASAEPGIALCGYDITSGVPRREIGVRPCPGCVGRAAPDVRHRLRRESNRRSTSSAEGNYAVRAYLEMTLGPDCVARDLPGGTAVSGGLPSLGRRR
ncbi:hypothetical protein OWR29_23905 [Actinoplanes sp. Pm04-4]|uniref:Uncharacterized protein n=1 Tax=Paractinoplanes pyxinae TaxID=2997416 RepID=A0ABT4B3I0_9ACTN|nr:hypothetical protein [Actinoplanes pyxinae]MCY1141054.1 hypothetical protein [Actinoplanes pyxinae]